MKEISDRLRSELAGRYTIERELGRGGMATSISRTISATTATWRSR